MNKENYKKTIDQIHAKEELKEKTFQNIKQKSRKKHTYVKYLAACAVVAIVFSAGTLYLKQEKQLNIKKTLTIANTENDLTRFQNIEELKDALKENYNSSKKNGDILEDAVESSSESESTKSESTDYSKTNTQVENVDEADIVKTDGEYIYYVSNRKVYIVKANDLKVVSEIEIEEENKSFYPKEIYINTDKLIILGNSHEYQKETTKKQSETTKVTSKYMAQAIVYDITNKEEPKQKRRVSLDGSYIESRMIGDNIYFISNKSPNYYKDIEDDEILPIIKDTAISEETKKIECTDIIYFKDTECYNYMIVGGFNINKNNEVNTEVFFGASSTIYASEENLYITQSVYKDGYFSKGTENTIYKFNLNDSQIKLQCKGNVEGYLNNQFSMDEYDGNLRIATTSGYGEESTNQLYILDENLKEIGKIENLAEGEKIYSVRFIGKVGYIVTFEQVDPLFVIDLSEPTEPVVKGQLKIPGYSSYLHPYDETHIIGIGYNTKSNGYGVVKNDSMKMSMFDVSDLENPKEMFNVSIGENYTYSQMANNHKALFYNKDKNLIGFPVTYRSKDSSTSTNELAIYKIDLEKGFEKYGDIEQDINYKTNIDRAIYIGDTLYTLSDTQIVSYDLNTMQKLEILELD